MRKQELIPIALLAGVAVLIVVQAVDMRGGAPAPERDAPASTTATRPRPAPTATASDSDSTSIVDAQQVADSLASETIVTVASNEPPPVRDLAVIQTLIRDGSPGTYLLNILADQEQLLFRWPERRMDAVRVWIDRNPSLPDWDSDYALVAERAFEEWQRAGFPLRFDIARDSAGSEIQIQWISAFPTEDREKLGMARKTRDQHGWIRAAELTIAIHDREGKKLAAEVVAGTIRHEVGHALGLGHSPNPSDVMFAESRTTAISAADRATLKLLYIIPPGPVK